MRVSTQQFFDQGVRGMQEQSAKAMLYQRQVSDGLRSTLASEAPEIAGAGVQVNLYEAQFEMFKTNQQYITNSLSAAENNLNSILQGISQIKTWMMQARNGTNTDATRQVLGQQVGQLRQSLQQSAQAVDVYGRPVFRTDAIAEVTVAPAISMPTAIAYADVMGRQAPDGQAVSGQVDILGLLSQVEQDLKAGRAPSDQQMTDIGSALVQVNLGLAKAGALQNRLDSATALSEDQALYAKSVKSNLLDVDPVQAASDLAKANAILKALQSMFGTLGSTSLFDKL